MFIRHYTVRGHTPEGFITQASMALYRETAVEVTAEEIPDELTERRDAATCRTFLLQLEAIWPKGAFWGQDTTTGNWLTGKVDQGHIILEVVN